jgi:hypothetical protein
MAQHERRFLVFESAEVEYSQKAQEKLRAYAYLQPAESPCQVLRRNVRISFRFLHCTSRILQMADRHWIAQFQSSPAMAPHDNRVT